MRKTLLFLIASLCAAQTNLGPRVYIGSHAWKSHTKSIALLAPEVGDSAKVAFQLPRASTVVRVSCATIGATTTASINLNKRAENTPSTPGTDVLSANLVCDDNSQTSCASGCDVNTIASGAIAARELVFLTISSINGTPGSLIVHVELNDD